MNNINDDIRNLLSKFDSTEKPTLKESTTTVSKNVSENNTNDDIRDMLSKLDSADKSILTEEKTHISPSGVKTSMDPSDDDYEINYGKHGTVAKHRKELGQDVKTGEEIADSKESKSFNEYLGETERQQSAPVSGDILEMIVNEEIVIEMPVVEHDDSSYTLGTDSIAESFFSACGCQLDESEYQGRDVELNQPMRGDVKKFKVYVSDPDTGNIKKVNFGSKDMEIKRDDPEARKSFRARHKCDQKSAKNDRDTAGYWSCKMWQSGKSVSDILKGK